MLRNEPTVLSNDPPNDNTPTSEWTATVSIQPQSAGTVPCSASITDYNTLRETVRSHTAVIARLGGSAASVSVATRHSLTITLAGPSLPNLTLLDLPGLVRTATKGQSPAIVAQCDALTDYYMAMPGCVVVCAVPANVDVATVEVLGRASVVDKEGGRTFGVVTKADCVDYGKEGETEEVSRADKQLSSKHRVLGRSYSVMSELITVLSVPTCLRTPIKITQNSPMKTRCPHTHMAHLLIYTRSGPEVCVWADQNTLPPMRMANLLISSGPSATVTLTPLLSGAT